MQGQSPPATGEGHEPEYRRFKRPSLIGLLVWAACAGAVMPWMAEYSLANSVVLAIEVSYFFLVLAAWCKANAYERRRPLGRLMTLSTVVVFVVGVPVYLFRSRALLGFRALALAALFTVGQFGAALLAALASSGATYVFRAA